MKNIPNLQMLTKRENNKKGKSCGKTQEQLFEDFFKSNLTFSVI